jgi:hypothetical protein
MEHMKTVNTTQRQGFLLKKQEAKDYELGEGKRLVQMDNEHKDLES